MDRSAAPSTTRQTKTSNTTSSTDEETGRHHAPRVPDGYVNRKMLRDQANISEHDLKSLEGQGIIKAAKIGYANWRLYTLAQVDRVRELGEEVRARREAKTNPNAPPKHLPAFRDQPVPYNLEEYDLVVGAVEQGVPRERIPCETRVHPAIVKNILKDQSELAGAIFIAKPIVDAINELALPGVGSIRNADDLLKAMKSINEEIVDGRKCLTCKDQRSHCLECATKLAIKDLRKQAAKRARTPAQPELGPDGLAIQPVPQTSR